MAKSSLGEFAVEALANLRNVGRLERVALNCGECYLVVTNFEDQPDVDNTIIVLGDAEKINRYAEMHGGVRSIEARVRCHG